MEYLVILQSKEASRDYGGHNKKDSRAKLKRLPLTKDGIIWGAIKEKKLKWIETHHIYLNLWAHNDTE